ncbi:hypothetical protein ACXYTJ_06545 [Gilvimarinus sp. F26214L]|uniref:hypothetical protein n=1 Tax=Gilvimarinus sp. DZF01 TaxID=3461371 RepID=UPI004045C9B3
MQGITKQATLFCFAMLLSGASLAADLSGTWVLNVDSPQGASTPTMTLTQDGDKVSGTYEGSLGSSDISGTVDGDEFTLVANLSMQGQDFALTYTGTQNGDSVSGNVDVAGMGGAPFTGKRQ